MIMTLTSERLKLLAREATALAEWTTVHDFATQIWGDQATRVEIETYGVYNDEGGTDYRIDGIIAYDKDGNVLSADLSLPFFATEACKEWDKDASDTDNLKGIWMDGEKKLRGGWILLEDLPVDEHEGSGKTYDLTSPPSLSLPIAY